MNFRHDTNLNHKSYFTSDPLNGDNKYTANDICKMIEFLVDNIYVRFGGQLFRQMVGIPMGTNCAPFMADLFLCSYENDFLDKLIKEDKRKLARKFNLSYRYIDDLISFKNKRFKEFISDILGWGGVGWGGVTWRDVTWCDVMWRNVTWRDVMCLFSDSNY